MCVFFPFILDVKFVGSTSRGHTGFLIHLPSAVRVFIFLARKIQLVSWSGTRVTCEMVSGGGGRFIPADIVGLHTLSLLVSSLVAHDRATEDNNTHHTGRNTTEHQDQY